MATLNQLSDNIAIRLNRPFDSVLKELIKDSYKDLRALYLKRTIERNGIHESLKQSYDVELELVDFSDSCFISVDCPLLKTKNKVAKPLQYKTDVPFDYVGTITGNSITHSTFGTIKFYKHLPLVGNAMYYFYMNDHIYVYGNTKLGVIRIESVFANPEQAISLCNNADCYDDDMEFPLPQDIIFNISNDIYNIFLNKINDEVQIDENNQRYVQATQGNNGREDTESQQ